MNVHRKARHFQMRDWFPPINLVILAYSRKGDIHGLSHILRVWTFSYILSTRYYPEADRDIITVASLFHDIGRKRDFGDPKHGSASAKWINEFLPLITNRFTKTQIGKITNICTIHSHKTPSNPSIELKILKDADALDRWRLPFGKLKPEYLRLPESHNLISFTREFYKEWKKLEREGLLPFDVLRQISKKFKVYSKLPLKLREQYSGMTPQIISNELKESEELLSRWNLLCKRTEELSESGKLTPEWIDKLGYFITENDLAQITNSFIKSLVSAEMLRNLKQKMSIALCDHTYTPKLINDIRHFYTLTNKQPTIYMSPNDENVLCAIANFKRNNPKKSHNMYAVLSQHLADTYRLRKLALLYGTSDNKHYQLIRDSLFNRKPTQPKIPNNFNGKDISQNPRLWMHISRIWIQQAISYSRRGKLNVAKDYISQCVYVIKIIFENDNIYLNVDESIEIIKTLIRTINTVNKYEIPYNLNEILKIWQQDFTYTGGLRYFPNSRPLFYANAFNLYDGINDKIKTYTKYQFKLLRALARSNITIDKVVENYLLPIALDHRIGSISDMKYVKRFITEKKLQEKADMLIRFKQSELQNNEHEWDHIIKYSKHTSKEHTKSILKDLGIKGPKVHTDYKLENYKVIMNILDVDILEKIVENDSAILSIWNVVGINSFVSKKFSPLISRFLDKNYRKRTMYRDIAQREMLIRAPNIVNTHGIYGSFEDITILEGKNKRREKRQLLRILHYPVHLFMTKRYGETTLVFKDTVKERSIFVFLDSIWKYRKQYVTPEDAVLLKNILSNSILRIALRSHPLSLTTAYIETIILGRTTLDDIEKIILPRRTFRKKRKVLNKILEKYPDVKVIVT